MEKKHELNETLVASAASAPLLAVYFEFNHLKQLYRQGWLQRGLAREQCESVADHVFGVMMLAWFCSDQDFPTVERDKLLRMALIHDLGEVYAGDITPGDGVTPGEKRRREREAVRRVVGRLPNGAEYLALWEEYESGQTDVARLVRQFDRLEMGLQAVVYEQQGAGSLEEFVRAAGEAIYTPEIQKLLEALKRLR